MIEQWIDEVTKVFEISDARFGTVRSFRLIERAEFPAAINPAELSKSPVALTIPRTVRFEYSEGGPHIAHWSGVTELHVAPSVDHGLLPSLLPWYGMLANAVTRHITLKNTAKIVFMLADREDAIAGPLALQFGDEVQHWGFLVQWQVMEHIEGQITVSQ